MFDVKTRPSSWALVDQLAGTTLEPLSPVQKYGSLRLDDSVAMAGADVVLLSLYALDKCVQRRFSYAGIYVLETSLVESLLPTFKEFNRGYLRSIMALNFCQLIYRFTAARRFRLSDTSTKQLRINSWGRELVIAQPIKRKGALQLAEAAIGQILDGYDNQYREVIALLGCALDTERASELARLNNPLPIKFVQ